MSEMQKNWGVTDFVFEMKRVENYPNFDESALVTRHGLKNSRKILKMIRYLPAFSGKFHLSGSVK